MSAANTTTMSPEELAKWYASRHFEIDPGVQEIYHLARNAPAREIRLLEVNTLVPEITPLDAFDFGVDIGRADAHTLNVVDVTPHQFEAIREGKLDLPAGWSLEDARKWVQSDFP